MYDSSVCANHEFKIPLDEIESVEYRYCDSVGDRIERGYFDTIEELENWIKVKRMINHMDYSDPYIRVPSTYFPFYVCDKIGSAYITITTAKRKEISIYFTSKKTTIEKDWNKSSDENKGKEEVDNEEKGEN